MVTETGTVPVFMTAEAGIVVSSLVALTKVVVCAAPLKLMTALAEKFVPSTSKGRAVSAAPLEGLSWLMAGMVPGCAGVVFLE